MNQPKPRVVAYVKPEMEGVPECRPCLATLRKLDELGVEFEQRDITSRSALALVRDELGYQEAPVVIVYDERDAIVQDWYGYRPDLLAALKAA